MPSTVFTSRRSHATPSTRQESTGIPSTSTVQVPHSPSSQPCLVPVRPRSSRRTSRSVLWGAKETWVSSPFRRNVTCNGRLTVLLRFRAKEKCLRLGHEHLPRRGIAQVEAIVVDDLGLLLEPVFPARLANGGHDSSAEVIGKRRGGGGAP